MDLATYPTLAELPAIPAAWVKLSPAVKEAILAIVADALTPSTQQLH